MVFYIINGGIIVFYKMRIKLSYLFENLAMKIRPCRFRDIEVIDNILVQIIQSDLVGTSGGHPYLYFYPSESKSQNDLSALCSLKEKISQVLF